jgi:hypothetical protein
MPAVLTCSSVNLMVARSKPERMPNASRSVHEKLALVAKLRDG